MRSWGFFAQQRYFLVGPLAVGNAVILLQYAKLLFCTGSGRGWLNVRNHGSGKKEFVDVAVLELLLNRTVRTAASDIHNARTLLAIPCTALLLKPLAFPCQKLRRSLKTKALALQ